MTKEELKKLEDTLWKAADNLRANSDLKSTEYSTPVLGLIFLRFADNKYGRYEAEIRKEFEKLKGTRRERTIQEIAVEKCGFYLPPKARYDYLLNLPEKEDIARAIKDAMVLIEKHKPELRGILPQDEYYRLVRKPEYRVIPKQLLKNFADIPKDATGDMFGQIYEYFLGNFALAEGQGGGEFFTPRSVVRLMVEIVEPNDGTVFDPACGSGGMFVQSAKFVHERRKNGAGNGDSLFVYGQEKTLETVKLAKMNIAVNGLRGDIRQANTYYEDPFGSFGKFDYVLANPPFNVDDVNLNRVESDKRFNTYGVPRNKGDAKKKNKGATTVPNANYLWINLFATSLKPKGRAGLVMANMAADARHSEAEIRKTLVEKNLVYAMLSLPSNMFYTVVLPATLWYFDRAKIDDKILFIDARNVFTQVDRVHREFSDEQIHNLAVISHLCKGDRKCFIKIVDDYFAEGMKRLSEHSGNLKDTVERVTRFLKEHNRQVVLDFKVVLDDSKSLDRSFNGYKAKVRLSDANGSNKLQRSLAGRFVPFFVKLHDLLKSLKKYFRGLEKEGKRKDMIALKEEIEDLHEELKETEYFFEHISWLQERFPKAEYEDVKGLCKLASLKEVQEQDYSLNPSRYVGVVIEEDGKTEDEFIEEMLANSKELKGLNTEAQELEIVIDHNIQQIAGEG